MKKVIITILAIIIIVLGGFLVYYNINQKESGIPTAEKNNNIDKKDISFFEDYLYYFLPKVSANNFLKPINEFNEEHIINYLYFYYSDQVLSGKLKEDGNNTYTYTVSRDEVKQVVKKYFGIDDFRLTNSSEGRSGIRIIDDDTYQIYWFPTGWFAPECTLTDVSYDGKNIKVVGKLSATEGTLFKENTKIIFHLIYNDGDYNIKSIEFDNMTI